MLAEHIYVEAHFHQSKPENLALNFKSNPP